MKYGLLKKNERTAMKFLNTHKERELLENLIYGNGIFHNKHSLIVVYSNTTNNQTAVTDHTMKGYDILLGIFRLLREGLLLCSLSHTAD